MVAVDIEAEMTALRGIVETFDALDYAAKRRVLDWAESRYGTPTYEDLPKVLAEPVAELADA